MVSFGLDTDNTSDRYHTVDTSLKYWRYQWEPGHPYPDEAAEGYNWGLLIERRQANLPDNWFLGQNFVAQFARKWSPELMASVGIGYHHFRNSPAGTEITSTSRLGFRGQLFYQYYRRDFLRFTYRNGFHYERQLGSGTALNPFSSQGFVLSNQNYLADRLRLGTEIEGRWVSNGVHRQTSSFNLVYGVSPSWPWIWVGVGGEYISHSGKTEDFYSPIHFRSIGSRAEASFPIYLDLSGIAAFNYNFLQEEVNPWGTGYYMVAGLKYGRRDSLNATFKLNRILSQQEKSSWSSNAAEFEMEYPF